MRSRLMVRFHLRQLNCRGFPLSVLKDLGCEKVFSDMLSGNTDNVRSTIYNILHYHHKDNIIFDY